MEDQNKDEEMKKNPLKHMCNYSFLEEEDGDTVDSMNITPVQAIVHHHKSSSSCRREKHTERRNHSNEKERKSHQHECKDRYRDEYKHHRHIEENLEEFVHVSQQQISSYQENEQFLSRLYTSKQEFLKEYRRLYLGTGKAEELYLLILTKLKKAISEGNINTFKKLSNLIGYTKDAEDQITLRNYYAHANNPIKNTNIVILACKHNKLELLECLFDSDNRILNYLSIDITRTNILPDDRDEEYHNAFYYAVRSGNVELLNTLINKWPGNYFSDLRELDTILSKAYEELKLKNISLSDKMEIFVENKLIDLRFFSNASRQGQSFRTDLNNIRERIELMLQNISLLKRDYLDAEEVDESFLFVAKFIAKNIHILKRQLKSTYNRLPWEEIEFCLVSFISSHIKRQEINLFYRSTLNKSKILNHLENFAEKVKEYIIEGNNVHIDTIADLPNVKREKIIAEIIDSYPQFGELYNDYQQLRDIQSLEKISDHVKLALSVNCKEREGQLIITRVLQVIGEHLKNTLESPKLSNIISEHLLLSLLKNTKKIIIDLRNSLSHAYSLFKRTEIEENKNLNFFIGIQNDIKKVGDVITNILYNNKIKIIRILLKKIINSDNLDEIKEFVEVLGTVKLDKMMSENENFKKIQHKTLENLITEVSDNISDKTAYEQDLIDQIKNIINSADIQLKHITNNYIRGFLSLKILSMLFSEKIVNHNNITGIKFYIYEIIDNMALQVKSHNFKEIATLSMKLFDSVGSKIQPEDYYNPCSLIWVNFDKVSRLLWEIFSIVELATDDMEWIKKLRAELNKKGAFPMYKQEKTYNVTEEKYNNQLALKLSELKNILSNNLLINGQLTETFPIYKSDEKLQAVVEMLVLDIMSILELKNSLENNLLFLDDNIPLLNGKCLRNHLAHGNALVDILLSEPSTTVVLNATKLVEVNIMGSNKKIGKLVSDDPSKLREKCNQGLDTITNQKRLFDALQEGNFVSLKVCLRGGADINARNIDLWTTLHFAAKGYSLKVIKFLLDQNLSLNVKDINGQSPLHIAAAYGRKNIVDFFVKEAGLYVDDVDNSGKTPLQLAARNGHKDTVKVLLENEANTVTKDVFGLSPLHYAIRNNHIDIVKILLTKDANADLIELTSGFTPLHVAAEMGHLELVYFLLEYKVDINAKNNTDWTPIHVAALNGHLEIVNALISEGADVNASVIDGHTPLHYAVKAGHEKIASILLKHGANVNAVDKTYNNTALHYAAKDGHEGIVKTLLKHKASVKTVDGITPLHLAVQKGHLGIVTILLEQGVNIHAKDKNNDTPLHYAVESGHMEVVELLIKNGAEVNAKNCIDETPLHVAALNGNYSIIDLLIKNKVEVNAQDFHGNTAIHEAAMNGNIDVIDLLIKKKAEVNARRNDGITPLHLATRNNHIDAIVFLIETGAEVNTTDIAGDTPLHVAVEAGHKEIVEILLAKGANINTKCNNPPLLSAIKNNNKEIAEILIANGANVDEESSKPLLLAVSTGYTDVVEILLKTAAVNIKGPGNITALHLAATRGHKDIVNALINGGADSDARMVNNVTPLCGAAQEGYKEIVEILIASGATVNVQSNYGVTPLHEAAVLGHSNVVKVLLNEGANFNIKDIKNRTSLELAVAHGHLEVVKTFLQYRIVDMNTKGNDNWTILHIASQESNLDMVKYLVDNGSDINAKNASGLKPMHIAAREGHKDTVEFFLSKGLNINDPGAVNQTLLHYAAMKGHLAVVKYLIAQGADVNSQDKNGVSPMHIAATFGYKDVTEILLKNGAVYNFGKLYSKLLVWAGNKTVINLLASTKKLFKVIKHNNFSDVEIYIKMGAFINAKNGKGGTPLHYTAWKGCDEVVSILLENRADPNAVNKKGFTPLHYAAKFSHLKVVKALLANGAVYNALSDNDKTPLNFTVDKDIISLFQLVNDSFTNIENDNSEVINDLNKIKDVDTIKAIMGAHNRENKTLVVAAMHSNFSKLEQLKQISQGSSQINKALALMNQNNYQAALNIFKSAFEKRKEILGPDNPGTLDIQAYISKALYGQGCYQEALNTFEEIFQKQKEILGLNNTDTLNTRSTIALMLHGLGKNEEAYNIYQEVYQKQTEILGSNHSDTLETQFHMALVLDAQGKYEEVLNINRIIFEKIKNMSDTANAENAVHAQNNMAVLLCKQGKYAEALEIYKDVYEKKKLIFGVTHFETLRTLHGIAGVLCEQKKYSKALKVYQDVLDMQKVVLGPNHFDTLNTQYNIANVLFDQGKLIGALKAYKESFDQIKAFEPTPRVLNSLKQIKIIKLIFKLEANDISEMLQHLQKDINIAASNGDVQTVQRLLKSGASANDKDIDGRTPLHYAVSNRQIGVVNVLLKNEADITQGTNKRNTPLHIATSKGYKEIVEVLLEYVSRDKLNEFINAKTAASGSTSLHVAASNGYLEIVKSLMKHGAIYNIKNKEGKTPLNLSKNQSVIDLLQLVEELFKDAKKGNIEIISKLKAVNPDEFVAAMYTRNDQGNTLLQVTISNKHMNITSEMLKMLKLSNQNL
ncbi:uncharacterized protein LOC105286418 isoform X2 [Ooceraea biroi]|nr:uncharacterized protein LOC105286418 isoform X2 [Ooceraea biroi]